MRRALILVLALALVAPGCAVKYGMVAGDQEVEIPEQEDGVPTIVYVLAGVAIIGSSVLLYKALNDDDGPSGDAFLTPRGQ